MNTTLLRGQLQTVKNNFALAQLGITLMLDPDALTRFNQTLEKLGEHEEVKHFNYIGYVFRSDALFKHATSGFRSSVLRNCLKEAFELVKTHARDHGKDALLKSQAWYPFLRIVRNCLSHDMVLRFKPRDLAQLPVSWSGLTIDASLQDRPLPASAFFTRGKALDLLDEVISYSEQAG